jgi:hypothetical protein
VASAHVADEIRAALARRDAGELTVLHVTLKQRTVARPRYGPLAFRRIAIVSVKRGAPTEAR